VDEYPVNEYEVIDSMIKAAGKLPPGYSKIGDDVAELPQKGGKLIIKSDMLVGRTDVPNGMTMRQAARKSVAMCVSDFASKGVVPDSYLISLGLKREISRDQVEEVTHGFADASGEWGTRLVGGDTNEADDLIIDCTMLGFSDRIVPRSAAKPGHLVVTTGYFGYPPAGLKILLEGAKAERGFRKVATQSVFRPSPNLRLGLGLAKFLRSAMDSSDGLAISLHTLAQASGVGFRVTNVPIKDDVKRFASENGYSATDLALYGGEEYLIVGTMERRSYSRARKLARGRGGDVIVIGETTGDAGNVVLTADGKGKWEKTEMRGWIHLT
jgi:thiamine-monophosphate kinase